MDSVLYVDPKNQWAVVQPGVPLDYLNDCLKPHGFFFPPSVSTSNRATIGGMVSTDASGKGSVLYGKTSDHVLDIEVAHISGETFHTSQVSRSESGYRSNLASSLIELLEDILETAGDEIERRFPKLNRYLTGYNLPMLRNDEGKWNIHKLMAGSEGTLGIFLEIKVKITPIPKHKKMVVVEYDDFLSALRHAEILMATRPAAIETMDEAVMDLAKKDESWFDLEPFWGKDVNPATKTINLVEYLADEEGVVESQTGSLLKSVNNQSEFPAALRAYVPENSFQENCFWKIRKKGVGLLGNMRGNRKPIAFIEDCAVPPEKLADFITEFIELLKKHNLEYGMFGHVDAGCMHVRPALDMTDPGDREIIRPLSDEVDWLCRKFGGVIWGEHGKGFRAEYAENYFGTSLVEQMNRIKRFFDPDNRLNPGKMFTPDPENHPTLKLDSVPLKGEVDEMIPKKIREAYDTAVGCNGNGECFNYKLDSVMCPSAKATKDPIHSPKGRAALIKEWLRMVSKGEKKDLPLQWTQPSTSPASLPKRVLATFTGKRNDFNHQVYQAMTGCLSCKACVSQCPVHVDIPEYKARFLALYHTRFLRPLRDYLLFSMEFSAPLMEKFPRISNGLTDNAMARSALKKIGFADAPRISVPTLSDWSSRHGFRVLNRPSEAREPEKTVILMQDAFTRFYDAHVLRDALLLLGHLGFEAYLAPYVPSGKPLHIKGFLGAFQKTAQKCAGSLRRFSDANLPILCLEPSVALMFREEYPEYLPNEKVPQVKMLSEYLAEHMPEQPDIPPKSLVGQNGEYVLLSHCTEKTSAPANFGNWKEIYARCGLTLKNASLGCCGMAGVYGHETEHLGESKALFKLSWEKTLRNIPKDRALLTGYSCRSQTKRILGYLPNNPVSALLSYLREP